MDDLFGLLLLTFYIAGMVGLAALVTFVAVKIFPTKDRPGGPDKKTDAPSSDGDSPVGRLFRRAKREAT